jgi:hypothetical protein
VRGSCFGGVVKFALVCFDLREESFWGVWFFVCVCGFCGFLRALVCCLSLSFFFLVMASSCSLRVPAVGGWVAGGSLVGGLLPSKSVRVSRNARQGGCAGGGVVVVRGDAAGGSSAAAAAPEQSEQQFDSKAFRKTLTRSENYNKSGFGYKKEMLLQMEEEYTSE